MSVVMVHSLPMPGFPEAGWLSFLVKMCGSLAVPLFFVLSGYLITHLLLREEAATGRISLKNFYARRALRILPASLAYLGGLAVLSVALGLDVKAKEFLASLFWYRNFLYGGWAGWNLKLLLDGAEYFTGHFWSLSVEEHFYFVWPLLFLLVPSRFRVWMLAVPGLVLLPIWRTYNLKVGGIGGMNYWRTDLVCDYLVLGALLAVLEARWRGRVEWERFWAKPWVPLLALGGILCSWLVSRFGGVVPLLGPKKVIVASVISVPTSAVGLVLLVGLAVHGRRRWLDPWLNSRPLVWLGGISFSLYLWQQVFCDESSRVLPFYFPFNLLVLFPVAMASHYWVERPFLGMRGRFRAKGAD